MAVKIGICEDGQVVQGVMVENTQILSKVSTRAQGTGSRGIEKVLRELLKGTARHKALEYVAVASAFPETLLEQRRTLRKVAVVRVSAPSGFHEPPLLECSPRLRKRLLWTTLVASGGHEIDGREIAPMDETELKWMGRNLKGKVEAVVVSSPFSPVYPDHEERATQILAEQLDPQTLVYPAHRVSDMGMPYRENAAVLNAALTKGVQELIEEIRETLDGLGSHAPLYLLQNNGLLMSTDYARAFPVLMLYSSFAAKLLGITVVAQAAYGVFLDHRQDSVWIGAIKQRLPLVSDLVDVDGVKVNSGGPTLLKVPSQGRLLAKALAVFTGHAQTEALFVNTKEGSQLIKEVTGREGVIPPNPEVLGALGAVHASLGVRLVQVFPSKVKLRQAFKLATQAAKQRCLKMGGDREALKLQAVYEAPIATLPAGAHRVVAVVTTRPSSQRAMPSPAPAI